nr:hypothetical protein [uncultured Actinoplanes sp.]
MRGQTDVAFPGRGASCGQRFFLLGEEVDAHASQAGATGKTMIGLHARTGY